ncbi:hypothetical protein OTB20_04395 [Streptomyces sp. H27-H1]|nr:hypothetical protein [Streptomyces sp. H27-H1]MCY0925455.1 hypothetical protein [Streptomyces sp. H27-H1]
MTRKRATAAAVSVLFALIVMALGAGSPAYAAAGEKKAEVIK